jgi:hypothetical protein
VKNRAATAVLVILLLGLLAWGTARLFALRYARGDNYPPYSTLRTDPLGAKALAEALALLPGVEVRRNFVTLNRLQPPPGAALVHLNLRFDTPVSEAEFKALEQLVLKGARAVFAFHHELTRTSTTRLPAAPPATAPPAPPAPPAPTSATPPATPGPGSGRRLRAWQSEDPGFHELAQRWEIAFDLAQGERRAAHHHPAQATPEAGDLEPSVPWHSALYFKALGERWRTLYACQGVPVVVERPYGHGSIVFCSDTFFFSNEGLRTAPRLLAAVLGLPRTVIFDEASHGVTEEENLATLARRLRLEGVAILLVVLAVLFVWKNAVPILPPVRAEDAEAVSGRDASGGFINLLRRSVPASRLPAVCVEAWLRARGRRVRAEERAHLEAVLRAYEARALPDPAAAYRAMAEGLGKATPISTPPNP